MSEHPHHTPHTAYRPLLDQLTLRLRELHRALIDVVQHQYERSHGPIGGPGNLLNLLMHDPVFAWMRPLSQLMADMDALLEQPGAIHHDDAAAVRHEVELLMQTDLPDSIFATPYFETLQNEPMLTVEHGRVRNVLAQLPVVEDKATIKEKRKGWSEVERLPLRQRMAAKGKAGHKPS